MKHIIGISLKLKLCEAPVVAQKVPIEAIRGVGRPTVNPKLSCFLPQTSTYTSQFSTPTATPTTAQSHSPNNNFLFLLTITCRNISFTGN